VALVCTGDTYCGEWADGRRNGLGRETHGRWVYHGEWTAGIKGRYGVRHSTVSGARYEGTWVSGTQEGFGVETYSDNSEFCRHALAHVLVPDFCGGYNHDSTAVRPRYDHSTIYMYITPGLLHCGLNK